VYDSVTKDPNAVLDYLFEWGQFLGDDEIATSTFPDFPAGITNTSTSNTEEDVRIWLTGGTKGSDYTITNRITTTGGRTMDWILVVRVYEKTTIPHGPPYAHIIEHTAYTATAEGEEAFKLEMVAADASDMVQQLAPRPPTVTSVLSAAADDSQNTLTVVSPIPTTFPESGEVLIDAEVARYSSRLEFTTLAEVTRGIHGTTPAAHASGAVVTEVGYALRARRAELMVFEWLFTTRGWRPSRSGVLGSEAYQVGDEVQRLVRQVMGPYYGRRGGGIRRTLPLSSFPRRRGTSYDWQMGWHDV
jgi:hypothetical protein